MFRNTIFSIFFFFGIILISLIFLPSLLMPQKVVIFGGKLMGYWSSFCLKFFLSTKITIKGLENINQNQKFFIAASHQSMFETFFFKQFLMALFLFLKMNFYKYQYSDGILKK